MKLISFAHGGGEKWGVVDGDAIIDMSAEYPSLRHAIRAQAIDEVASAAARATAQIALSDIEYRIPILPAGKVFCVGRNYATYHKVLEDGQLPEWPSVFAKYENCFAAHGQPIIRPRSGDKLDYEAELAVVIGKSCRYIDEADALGYVLGYTVVNDGTVRDYSARGTQAVPSKNFYQASAMGPWIVTADEVSDHANLAIKTWVSGELRQDGNTREMIFKLPYMIAYISQITELEPGDVISTGSPPGSALDHDPPGFLRPGQVLEIEVEGVGRLRHPIEAD